MKNILAIDGGGIRGLIAATVYKKLDELARRPLHEIFNLTAGVSLARTAEDHGVDPFSGIAIGDARVTRLHDKVSLRFGRIYAAGNAHVTAFNFASSDEGAANQRSLEPFNQPVDAVRGELLSRAQGMLKRKTRD